jgi:hypothetical protein
MIPRGACFLQCRRTLQSFRRPKLWGVQALVVGSCAVCLAQPAAPWMSQEAIRAEFTGRTLQGYYYDGADWLASYAAGGRYDIVYRGKNAQGEWYFHEHVMCLFYGPPHWPLYERCVVTTKVSANCYDFRWVWPDATPRGPVDLGQTWHARGWRQGEPSTCEDRPSA